MITRTQRETVMLEALGKVAGQPMHMWVECPLARHIHRDNRGAVALCGDCQSPDNSPRGVASRALATVKAMDDAEIAAQAPRNAFGEVMG